MSHPGSILPAPSSFTSWPTVINFGEANLRMYRIFTMNNWYKRLPRRGFVWRRQITFGSNGAEEEWLSQNSTLSSWSTFTAAGTLISLETDWLLWLQQGSITLDPWPLTWNEKEGRRRKASENCRQVMSGSWKPECRALFLRKWRRIAENDQLTSRPWCFMIQKNHKCSRKAHFVTHTLWN